MTNSRTFGHLALLSLLFSSAAMANDMETCLREYQERYFVDREASEAHPPMTELYPSWQVDCRNGGELNKKIKLTREHQHASKAGPKPYSEFEAYGISPNGVMSPEVSAVGGGIQQQANEMKTCWVKSPPPSCNQR